MVIPIPHPTGIVRSLKRLFLQTLAARGYILIKRRRDGLLEQGVSLYIKTIGHFSLSTQY